MDRRGFLKLCGLTALGMIVPLPEVAACCKKRNMEECRDLSKNTLTMDLPLKYVTWVDLDGKRHYMEEDAWWEMYYTTGWRQVKCRGLS